MDRMVVVLDPGNVCTDYAAIGRCDWCQIFYHYRDIHTDS